MGLRPADESRCPCQGLEWMLRRERRGEAAGRSVIRLFPGWLQFVTAAGHVFYVLQNGW